MSSKTDSAAQWSKDALLLESSLRVDEWEKRQWRTRQPWDPARPTTHQIGQQIFCRRTGKFSPLSLVEILRVKASDWKLDRRVALIDAKAGRKPLPIYSGLEKAFEDLWKRCSLPSLCFDSPRKQQEAQRLTQMAEIEIRSNPYLNPWQTMDIQMRLQADIRALSKE